MHQIIKRFRETGDVSAHKARRPSLETRGLRALWQHSITHRRDCVPDITKWAQEYFQKPLLVNTIHRAIYRCQLNLCHLQRKSYLNMLSSKASVSDGMECISAYCLGSWHVLKATMNAERCIKVSQQHVLSSRWRVFQQDKPHAAVTSAWLCQRQVQVLNWPAPSVPDREDLAHQLKKKKYVKDYHELVGRWKPISGKNGTQFHPKPPETITLIPRCLQTVWKEEGMLHRGKHAPPWLFWDL